MDKSSTPADRRFRLIDLMALIAGLAIGLWMCRPMLREPSDRAGLIFGGAVFLLGGLSLVGVPLLLAERRRRRGPWEAGRLLWFASGTSAWLLWPPIIYKRATASGQTESAAAVCFAYGTPLMALYVVAALLAGGRFRRSRRRRMRRSWRERFGLLLGLAWACTGLYVLYGIYSDDLR